MQEKAPEELDGVECHRTLPIAPLVILPAEGHLAVVTGQQPPIGDGDAMRVAGEVAEHLLRSGQGGLGVDDPLRLLERPEELVPGRGRTPVLALALHAQALLGGRLPERRQERAPKEPAEDTDREEETFGARDPRPTIER